MITRRLWLNADTDKAVLVGTEPSNRHPSNRWIARSLITIIAKEPIENPRFSQEPGIAQQLGVMLTFDAPAWVLDRAGFVRDAEIKRGMELGGEG